MVSALKPDRTQSLMGELPSLEQCQTKASTVTERRRWQVLVLIASGKTRREICAITGYSLRTIRQIVQRFRTDGMEGLADGRKRVPTSTLLTAAQQQALHEALQHPPQGGGVWTGSKVAQWMATATGKPVHRQRGWEYLQRFAPKDVAAGQRSSFTSRGR
jgi:transposase